MEFEPAGPKWRAISMNYRLRCFETFATNYNFKLVTRHDLRVRLIRLLEFGRITINRRADNRSVRRRRVDYCGRADYSTEGSR